MSKSPLMKKNAQTRPLLGLCGVLAALILLGLLSKAMLVVAMVIAFVGFVHELGHFIAARVTGMKATEFFWVSAPVCSASEKEKLSLG